MRVVIASLCFVSIAAAAGAQTSPVEGAQSPAVLDQVYACANVSAETERLACYDQAVGRLRAAQSSGDVAVVDRAQAETVGREAFGFSLPSLPRLFNSGSGGNDIAPVAEVTYEIARVVQRGDGRYVFTMTNGHVWAQSNPARVRNVEVGDTVSIDEAALGNGFVMHVESGPAYRVRRQE